MAERPRPPQPTRTAYCDWGACRIPSTGWRWVPALREWTRVCIAHRGTPAGVRRGDYVPDHANVLRQAAPRG